MSESEEFRHICQRNLYAIRKIPVTRTKTEIGETVLYTYEESPHLEFLIRAAIICYPTWSHTVLCGVQNIEFIQNMCAKIGDIKVINTGHKILKRSEHMRFMLSSSFWNLFTAPLVLLYDADSCLVDSNMSLTHCLSGYGGLTLRNRRAMLECLRPPPRINIEREDAYYNSTIFKRGLGTVSSAPIGLWKPWLSENEVWKDSIMKLVGKRYNLNANIKIYILCYNQERFDAAGAQYPYSWAHPILMKYQNCTFENAFWPQLLEIRDEWASCEFVGTIAFTAKRKINVGLINKRIIEGYYTDKSYVHFSDTGRLVLKNKTDHPNFKEIWTDMLKTLQIPDVVEGWCNYWMCTPALMDGFLAWHRDVLTPVVLAHPLIYSDSKYKGALSEADLVRLWGRPYYPMVPFIMERINRAFFSYVDTKLQ